MRATRWILQSSGRCRIIHWRQVHKLECQQLGNSCSGSSPKQQPTPENTSSDNVIDHRQRGDPVLPEHHSNIPAPLKDAHAHSECTVQENVIKERQRQHPFYNGYNCGRSNSSTVCNNRTNSQDIQVNLIDAENLPRKGITSNDETLGLNHSWQDFDEKEQ
ncbi:ubiquitin carboxyl-terminal hydrolase 15 [Abeliophyllum distichum]|uniref:Ubiquitin carboxyl-terminal hydrolase 15 n=1 Tax=Abeliophyllum distichum TaxID=126358 RepID=A0ABD1UGF6_9LAMI